MPSFSCNTDYFQVRSFNAYFHLFIIFITYYLLSSLSVLQWRHASNGISYDYISFTTYQIQNYITCCLIFKKYIFIFTFPTEMPRWFLPPRSQSMHGNMPLVRRQNIGTSF